MEGVFYLVAVERNEPLTIIETMKERGMLGEVSLICVYGD